MANHIVLNSRFNPFSYQEMVHPVQMATQSHQQLEGELGEVSSQTEAIGAMTNAETDPESYAKYKAYIEQVQEQARQLGSQGLQPGSRRGLMSVRDSFASEIMPIAAAHTKREQLSQMLSQAQLQNPTLIIDKDPSVMSLDEFVRNPSWQPRTHQGSMLTQQSMQVYSNLAKQMSEDPDMIKSILGGQYFEILKKAKFNIGDIMEALVNSENAAPELIKIREDLLRSSGIPEWGNPQAEQQAIDAINQGMWAALGQDQSQMQANKNYGMTGGGTGSEGGYDPYGGMRALVTSSKAAPNEQVFKYDRLLNDINISDEYGLRKRYSPAGDFEGVHIGVEMKAPAQAFDTRSHYQDNRSLEELQKIHEESIKNQIRNLGIEYDGDDYNSKEFKDAYNKARNDAVVMYSSFNMMGAKGSYANLGDALSHSATTRSTNRGKRKGSNESDILDYKGKSVNSKEFSDDIEEGITGVLFNRNGNDPRLSITTTSGNFYDVHASMVGNLDEVLKNIENDYDFYREAYANDKITKEEFEALMLQYDIEQFNAVRQVIFQGYHQAVGPTGIEKMQ